MASMDEPESHKPPEVPLGDVFSEIPLFREIQRVLLSGTGPVNWELARQVAIAVASWGTDDPPPTDEDRRGFEDTVRAAELHVAELTGLSAPSEVATIEVLRRSQWVEAAVRGLRELIEPSAARMSESFAKLQQDQLPLELGGQLGGAGAGAGAAALLGPLSALLLGVQTGTVLGTIGQRALGQYDVPLPRPATNVLQFVVPTIARFEEEWSLTPLEFRARVALHEVVHRFEFARPWVRGHLIALVRDYASTLDLDLGGLQERLERMDISDPEALQQLFQSDQGLFGPVMDDEQRLKLARVQSFVAAAEGYGEHVTSTLGSKMLRSERQIVEALRRSREGESDDPVFERLLGIEMKLDQVQQGVRFCETVVEQTDEATLARMWDSAENLPSLPELEEPRLWLARVA
jgi:putative hydrolase